MEKVTGSSPSSRGRWKQPRRLKRGCKQKFTGANPFSDLSPLYNKRGKHRRTGNNEERREKCGKKWIHDYSRFTRATVLVLTTLATCKWMPQYTVKPVGKNVLKYIFNINISIFLPCMYKYMYLYSSFSTSTLLHKCTAKDVTGLPLTASAENNMTLSQEAISNSETLMVH